MSRRGSSRAGSIYILAAEVLVACALVVAVACLGGAPVWALWPLVGFSSAALGFSIFGALRRGHSVRVPELSWVLGAAAVLCALQLIPLPAALLSLLSAEAADLRSFTLVPLGLSAAGPVSLDPPGTWRELAKHLSYLALFLAAAQVLRVRKDPARALLPVAASGVAVAVVGLGHLLFGTQTLFGFYDFLADPPVVTPFGNPNHLAAFLAVSACAAAGLALLQRSRSRAWMWGLGYLTIGSVLVLSLSRGGITFFVFSQLLFGLLLWRARAREDVTPVHAPSGLPRPGRSSWRPGGGSVAWVLGGVLVIAAVGAYLALEPLERELSSISTVDKAWDAKPSLWPAFWEAAAKYPVLGMGRGAFEAAFTRYQGVAPDRVFTHPENVVLQLAAEFGVVPLVALVLLSAFALVRSRRARRLDVPDAVALSALAGVLLHDLFDFSLELPATAVAVVLLLPLLCRKSDSAEAAASSSPSPTSAPLRLKPAFALARAGILTVVGAVGVFKGSRTLQADEALLAARLTSGAQPQEALQAALPLIDRHPSDYLLYGMLAASYSAGPKADPLQTLAFANRALFLRPLDPDAHVAAARALLRLGRRSQAMLEYRLAVPAGGWRIFDESLRVARTVDELVAVIPQEPMSVQVAAQKLWAASRKDEAIAVLDHARSALGPVREAARLWVLSASFTLSQGSKDHALELAREAARLDPDAPDAPLAEANVLAAKGDRLAAIERLQVALKQHIGHFALSVALAQHLHTQGDKPGARAVLRQLEPFIDSPAERAQLFATEGGFLRSEGRTLKALDAYESAARVNPRGLAYHHAVAQLLENLGRPDDAIRALNESIRIAGRTSPQQAEWLERLAAQEAALVERRKQSQWLQVTPADLVDDSAK